MPSGSTRWMDTIESLSLVEPADGERTESGPGGRRAGRCEPCVAVAFLLEEGAERGLPTRAERGNPERTLDALAGMPRQVEQRVDLRNGHPFRPRGDLEDLVARLHLAFDQHTQVEAGTVV